jgi:lantibiotic biosynthesis protein
VMYELGIRPDTCLRLSRAGADFVLAHRRQQPLGLFPLVLGDDEDEKQFSQCYGDLGPSYGLFRAAQLLPEHTHLQAQSRDVLLRCAQRTQADNCTPDGTITYGAAGLAAVFDKLFRLSHDPIYEAAANHWYESILAYVHPDKPYAHMLNRFGHDPNTEFMQISFGWGIIGVGIALMQYHDKSLPPLDGLIMTI